jgi:hypothetical protein
MQTTTNPQLGLLDSLMIATPTNDFLERLDLTLDWRPLEKALQAMYPATTGRPPVRASGALQDEFAPALLRPVRPAVRGTGQ